MLDLDNIDEAILIARGKYSTLRSAQKKELERLREQCTLLQTQATATLRNLQDNQSDDSTDRVLANTRAVMIEIEKSAASIIELRTLLNELRPIAWPK